MTVFWETPWFHEVQSQLPVHGSCRRGHWATHLLSLPHLGHFEHTAPRKKGGEDEGRLAGLRCDPKATFCSFAGRCFFWFPFKPPNRGSHRTEKNKWHAQPMSPAPPPPLTAKKRKEGKKERRKEGKKERKKARKQERRKEKTRKQKETKITMTKVK